MLLVSDLDDDSSDVERVSQVAIAYRRAGIPLHVVGLNASPEDAAFIRRFVTDKGSFTQAALPSESDGSHVGQRRILALAALALVAALGTRDVPVRVRAASLEGHMSRARIVLGVVAVAFGLAALVLARDVRVWDDALDRGDAQFATRAGESRWAARGWLPRDAAPRVLGLNDDLAVRRAERAFAIAASTPGIRRRPSQGATRSVAEIALADVVAGRLARPGLSGREPARHPRGDDRGTGRTSPAGDAAEMFDAAIRADPGNVDAKHNLELLLRRIKVVGTRQGAGTSTAGDYGAALAGAGAGLPGAGY